MSTLNFRSFLWFATGVVLTVTSIAISGAWNADAAGPPGESTFVPVAPCRLFDTRPAERVPGSKTTPLRGAETRTQQVTGAVGNCTIPAGATGVAMNVTIVNPTRAAFLVLFPANEPTLPVGSNLNWVAGQSPTPNKVDVKLSSTGQVKIYISAGTVDVLADIVGYYTGATLANLEARLAGAEAMLAWVTPNVNSLLNDTNVIPRGVTVKGTDKWDFTSVKNGEDVVMAVQLPGSAPVPLTNATVNFGNADPLGNDDDPTCTGTAAAPTAPAGRVCIYTGIFGRVHLGVGNAQSPDDSRAFGVRFVINEPLASSNDAFVWFSWAYTAP